MTEETQNDPLMDFSGAMEAALRLSGASRLLEAVNRLALLLEEASAPGEPEPSSEGCRPSIRKMAAVLALEPSPEELLRLAAKLDLRDLLEVEVAYLEQVTPKTVQLWRQNGTGPAYRNEAGIRYPLSWYLQWRRKGRQTLTSQKKTRGYREL